MDSNAQENKIFSGGIGFLSNETIGELRIGDVTLEIDASDPDFLEKLQDAGEALKSLEVAAATEADRTRLLIGELDRHFDELFGEGTAAKAFKTNSLIKRINAWGSIVELANAQKDDLGKKMSVFNAKFNAGNRAQRRAAEKKKRPPKKGDA